MCNTIIIRKHPRELHDLQEFFCLLTKQCNSNCEFCIERKVHTGGFMSKENFISSVNFAKEIVCILVIFSINSIRPTFLFFVSLNIISYIVKNHCSLT